RPRRGGRQVDRRDPGLLVARGVRQVRLRRGGLEHEVGQRGLRQQPVHALRRRRDAHLAGELQPVRLGDHPDHRVDLDQLAAPQLAQQVRADVAGTHDRGGQLAPRVLRGDGVARPPGRLAHVRASFPNRAVTEPIPANVAVRVSPGATGTAAVIEPGSTTWPASRVTPRSPRTLASQTSALIGEPSTAPPAPVSTRWPSRWSRQPISDRSRPSSRTGRVPSTTPPLEALSAIVSGRVIFQSAIRESITSSAGSTYSTAATAS